MAIIAAGTLAFDSLKTVEGQRDRILGGSLTHFANAAAFLSKPRLVGVVGNDFQEEQWSFIREKASDVAGVETLKNEKSFFWKGYYTEDFDTAHTEVTELNALAKFAPVVPETYKKGRTLLFLANIDPNIQREIALQCPQAELKILDTMNFWIQSFRGNLEKAFEVVDGIVINEGEAFLLTGEKNILNAVQKLMRPNFKLIIVKKGSQGVMVFGRDFKVTLPAYPLQKIVDPTGAGDSFAGAFMSYLDSKGTKGLSQEQLKNAAAYATVVASFAVQGFGVDGIHKVTKDTVMKRFMEYKKMVSF